jgi:hypothetical protein
MMISVYQRGQYGNAERMRHMSVRLHQFNLLPRKQFPLLFVIGYVAIDAPIEKRVIFDSRSSSQALSHMTVSSVICLSSRRHRAVPHLHHRDTFPYIKANLPLTIRMRHSRGILNVLLLFPVPFLWKVVVI